MLLGKTEACDKRRLIFVLFAGLSGKRVIVYLMILKLKEMHNCAEIFACSILSILLLFAYQIPGGLTFFFFAFLCFFNSAKQ